VGGGVHSGRGLRERACERGWERHEIRLGGAHGYGGGGARAEGWGRGRGGGGLCYSEKGGWEGEGVIYPTAGLLDSYSVQ
jgi:hypothetical protein